MREILFRGKRLDNGEWVESGSLLRTLCLDKSNHIATIRKTSLRLIKKLNKGKDKAIDALCNPDEKDEYRKWVSNHE